MPTEPVPYPSGIVTFLFTDIVGSTQATRALPYQHYSLQLLGPQFAEIRRLVEEEHHGRISGTPAGDSIMAAFGDVNDALECAVAIQDALPKIMYVDGEGRAWGLMARIGVHASEKQVCHCRHLRRDGNVFLSGPCVLVSPVGTKRHQSRLRTTGKVLCRCCPGMARTMRVCTRFSHACARRPGQGSALLSPHRVAANGYRWLPRR